MMASRHMDAETADGGISSLESSQSAICSFWKSLWNASLMLMHCLFVLLAGWCCSCWWMSFKIDDDGEHAEGVADEKEEKEIGVDADANGAGESDAKRFCGWNILFGMMMDFGVIVAVLSLRCGMNGLVDAVVSI